MTDIKTHALVSKATLANADEIEIVDSAASNERKKVAWSVIQAAIDAASGGSVATDTIWDAAGDLVVGTGSNTAARLAKGIALQTLRVNAGATALEWATISTTTIVGITGTKAEFDTAVTDGNFAYQSDLVYIPLATSIANRLTKRSGTTGLLTDSGVTVDASDNVTGVAALTASGAITAKVLNVDDATSTVVKLKVAGVDKFSFFTYGTYFGLYDYLLGAEVFRANKTDGLTVYGAITASGAVVIGGGTTIAKVLSATATLNFASIAAGGFEDLTITVTGATVGSTVVANPPTASVTDNITYDAWVSAADTVTVRASNNNLITARDPASGTFRATVINF